MPERDEYHLRASRASAMASGWNSTFLLVTLVSQDLPPRLGPRDGFHFAGADFLETTGNLGVPRCFGILIDFSIEAVEQSGRQCRTSAFGKSKGSLNYLLLFRL